MRVSPMDLQTILVSLESGGKKERLRYKTQFLVALTSAHRISELHALLRFLSEKALNLSIWKRTLIKDEDAGALGRGY